MNRYEACMLLDFYGQLLTSRTKLMLDLYYSEDMSLAEIADQENISRQAVHDSIRRGQNTLSTYEDKLGLVKRFSEQKKMIQEALTALNNSKAGIAVDILDKLNKSL